MPGLLFSMPRQHLMFVAALLWGIGVTETLLAGSIKAWFVSGFFTFAMMGLGWVFGVYILKHADSES